MSSKDLDIEYERIQQMLAQDGTQEHIKNACYKTNNRYAYKYDLTKKPVGCETKVYNFVSTYDHWCLYDDKKNCDLRCSKCKLVYFCNKECQKKAWPIHKNHCNRDLFIVCITFGEDCIMLNCDACPVKFCSKECYNKLYKTHKDFDCDVFSKLFGISTKSDDVKKD